MTNFNQSKILASRLLQGSAIIGLAAMWATGAMAQANSGNTQVAETIETVTVTGTAIRGIIAPVGDNVITVDRDTIEATGANDVQQLLTTIPSVTGFGNPGQGGFGSADGSGTNAPTIHSLGASASNSTLILVDDHRIPLSGLAHSLSDPSTIPTIALQRVEVLADGASSIYGSDAVAGVINFITRRNYEGAETDVEYGDGLNYNQFTASQIIGTRWDHGSFMAAYQYSSNSQLLGTDRSFVNDNQTFRGLSNLGNFAGDPATIASTSSSLVYPYPYTAGTGVTNTATTALYGQARYSALLPSENRNAALVNVTEDVSDWLTVSAQLNWSSRIDDLAVGRNPGAGAGSGGTGVTATVYGPGSPAANAAQINPFYVPVPGSASGVETIRIDFNPILGPGAFTKSGTTVVYAAPEADIKLGGDWLASISGVAGATSSFSRTVGQVCASCVYLGLNGTTNSGGSLTTSSIPIVLGTTDLTTRTPLTTANALNVWGAAGSAAAGGANTSAAVLAQLTDNNSLSQTNQNMNEFNIKAGGTLFNDGAGDIKTSFGGEYRNYGIYQYTINNDAAGPSSTNSSNFSAKFGRSVYAAYAEFLIPVVSPAWNIPLVKSVDIDISGRYDHYSDVGDTKNPKVGIDWDIIDGLKARGSYSTSFVAPALTSTGGVAGLTTESNVSYGTGTGGPATVPAGYANNGGGTAIACAAGCTVGNSTNQGITIAGPGGATVKPETGTAYSAGLDFDAGKWWNILHGLTGNVTYWQDKLVGAITSPVMTLDTQIASLNKNLIIDPSAAQIAAAYSLAGVRVASVPSGPVTFLQYYVQQNAFNLWANGIDFTVNYSFQPNDNWGLFNVGLDGSQKLRFDQQGGGFGGAIVNNLNKNANTTFSSLAFLGRGSLGWQLDSFSSNLFVNYTESYYQPTTSVPFTAAGYFRVPAYVTVDMTLAYSLPEGMFPYSGGTQLYVTADDLFNQGPPPYNLAAGYDASDASPLGRLVLIGLRKKW
jgi:iron complex outermembrane recepter protein